MGAFADSIRLNSDKAMKRVNRTCYQITKELFRTVINFTPSPANPGYYAEGTLANQWYPLNGITLSTMEGSAQSTNGAASHYRVNSLAETEFLYKDGAVTMANNLPYAYRAEVLGWPPPKWSGGTTGAGYQGTGGPYRMVMRAFQVVVPRWK